MKKLKPTLPKDEKEIFEKGFTGNISGSAKFVTDGHSIFLAASAPSGMIFKKAEHHWGKPVAEKLMQGLWDTAEKRERVPAHFLGCGKVKDTHFDEDKFVAVLRDEKDRVAVFDPWILKFVVSVTGADGFAFGPGERFYQEILVVLREESIVGCIMPMRYGVAELKGYKLDTPAVLLSEA